MSGLLCPRCGQPWQPAPGRAGELACPRCDPAPEGAAAARPPERPLRWSQPIDTGPPPVAPPPLAAVARSGAPSAPQWAGGGQGSAAAARPLPLPIPLPPPSAQAPDEPAADGALPAEETPLDRRWPLEQMSISMLVSMVCHMLALVILGLIVWTPQEVFEDFALVATTEEFATAPDLERAAPLAVEAPSAEPPPLTPELPEAVAVAIDAPTSPQLVVPTIPSQALLGALDSTGSGAQQGVGLDGLDGLSGFGQRLSKAGAKTGDIQISLVWNNQNDIDLHVIHTLGRQQEHISFLRRRASTGGELDVDMNAGPPFTLEPVENIFWPKGKAPPGTFEVYVDHYANYGARDPTAFEVAILVDGEVKQFKGQIRYGESPRLIYRFTRANRPTSRAPTAK